MFFHFFSSPCLALRTRFALRTKCHVHLPWLIKCLLCKLMKVHLRQLSIFAGNLWTTDLAILSTQRLSGRQFFCSMSCDLEVTSESAYSWRKNKLNNNLLPLLNVAQALIECRQLNHCIIYERFKNVPNMKINNAHRKKNPP